LQAKPAPRSRRALPALSAVPASAVPQAPQTNSELERMAATLAAHPDFKVVRRLVPCRLFDAASESSDAQLVTLLVLDTETTGLNPARDKMVELAMLRVQVDRRTGQPVGAMQVYNGLEDPGMPMPDEARAVTGITDDMLRGQRLDDAQVHAMLAGADLVIAHNAGFDRPFVEARFAAFEGLKWACSFADIDWKSLGRGSAKLGALGMDLGFFYDAHRAEMDCHALLAVLMAPLLPLGETAPMATDSAAPVRNGLLHLLAAAQSPSFRVQATGAPFEAKDALKARGYRWDGTGRVWHTRLKNAEAFAAECDWLKQEVYGGRSARIDVEERDALSNYALRPGKARSHAL
jgi:DNA polymerase-3 subunit epsilon